MPFHKPKHSVCKLTVNTMTPTLHPPRHTSADCIGTQLQASTDYTTGVLERPIPLLLAASPRASDAVLSRLPFVQNAWRLLLFQ